MLKNVKPGVTLFLTIVFALGLVGLFSVIYQQEKMTSSNVTIDSAYHQPEKEKLTYLDSLPYYQYKQVKDSLDRIDEINKSRNTLTPGYRMGIGFFGVTETSSYYYDYYGDRQSHLNANYFISIPHYALNPMYRFVYKDGKNYLVKNNRDTTAISVAYLGPSQTVLIPVSKKGFRLTRNILSAVIIILIGVGIYIYLVLPITILINIASGKVFTKKNIRNLSILAYATLGRVLIQLSMPYLAAPVFMKKIPGAFSISFYDVFTEQLSVLMLGTILLAIASAFAKGYKLQQYQDLTI